MVFFRQALVPTSIVLVCLFAVTRGFADDFPRDRAWYTSEYDRFVFHYTRQGAASAAHLLDLADHTYDVLSAWVNYAPTSKIHVVVITDNDLTNGSATPYPRNHIRIYTMAPRTPSLLLEHGNWLEFLFLHEMAHIFQIDLHRMPGTIFRKIFGRNFVQAISTDRTSYPIGLGFANALLPDTLKEGYAVWAESTLLDSDYRGRANGAFSLSLVRNLARDEAIPAIGSSIGLRRTFPGGASPYQFGGRFHLYLAEHHGKDWQDFYHLNARGIFPFLYVIPYRISLGAPPRKDWNQWVAHETELARRFDALLTQETEPHSLAGPFRDLTDLDYDIQLGLLASISDGKRKRRVVAIAPDGKIQHLFKRDGGHSFTIAADGRFFYEAASIVRNHVQKLNLYVLHPDGQQDRLTWEGGSMEPDILGNKMVFVRRTDPGYCLVVHHLAGGELQPVPAHTQCFAEDLVPHRPRFSPDGNRVAFSLWNTETYHDIAVWNISESSISIVATSAADELYPQFSRDGRMIYFVSTTNGHPELYRRSLTSASSNWEQLTQTRRGVWLYTLSDEMLYVAAPAKHGWHIESVPRPVTAITTLSARPITMTAFRPPVTDGKAEIEASAQLLAKQTPYRPGRTALPTGWSPTFGLGLRETDRYGIQLAGQDVIGFTAWDLQGTVSNRKNPAISMNIERRWEVVDMGVNTQFFPVSEVTFSDATFIFRNELVLQRPIRRIDSRQRIGPSLAVENRFRPTGLGRAQAGLVYGFDNRESYAWSIVPGSGIAVTTRLSADSGFEDFDKLDVRTELSLQSGGFLFWKTQWQLSTVAAAHLDTQGPLQYSLRPPSEVAAFARRFISRAVPGGGIPNVDRFVLWEGEWILPLWFAERGPGSMPLYFDYLATRWFVSGGHWQTTHSGFGQQIYAGTELELNMWFNWSFPFPPIRAGVRWPVLLDRTGSPDFFIRVGATFSG